MAKRTRKRTARTRSSRKRSARVRKDSARDDSAGREFQRLVDVMKRLRGPGGCPWDREQTIHTLRPFVLEETYEVLDAIDRTDHEALRDEIGDLLFEGVFLAQIASDEGRFTVADSLRHITAKLVRRHPHVFEAKPGVDTAGKVLEQWEQIKSRERKGEENASILRGMPQSLPALLGAHEIGTRVAAVGFDWPKAEDVLAKIEEEVAELRNALGEGRGRVEEEMGDLLFAIANLARKLAVEPESALRQANQKFRRRFQAVERAFESEGRSIHGATLEEMERAWQETKTEDAVRREEHDAHEDLERA
jgi:nucleoside triphosphate diphosphatase